MQESYQIPALILTALLLPAFGHLYFRSRDIRTLLWFLGFLIVLVRMLLQYKVGWWDFSNDQINPWVAAIAQASIPISSALFLASLSPLSFRVGRFNILYVIPFTLPLVVYSVLFFGVYRGAMPHGRMILVYPILGLLAMLVGMFWGAAKGNMPPWLGAGAAVVLGSCGLWVYFATGPRLPLTIVECANNLMTALLILFVFRRFSQGVFLGVLGFGAWSLPILKILPAVALHPDLALNLDRTLVMAKVIAALGMILIALEDELATNNSAQERERRGRRELDAYSNLILSQRRVEDFDRQGNEICKTIEAHSRFAQVALLLESAGRYRLAGAAGLDPATAAALGVLAARIPVADFLAPGSLTPAVPHSQTVQLDLTPWLKPGDDLKRLHFTAALAVPMIGRSATEGVLLLARMRNPPGRPQAILKEPLRSDDLLPIEMLAARLQAVRSQTMMLEKLIDSEKFSGLGQLAGNVTQQLNNPLTVILGYASLLDGATTLDPQERKGVESILIEARRMRATLESLSRISRRQTDQLAAVSVSELLADMEQLHRSEFLQRSIEFRLSIAPALPRVICQPQQLRQAVLHCLQFAMEAADTQTPNLAPDGMAPEPDTRVVRLEATSEGNVVQILVAHSGPGFLHPERAFDPFVPSQATGEIGGLGLGLCATILRDHNGRASAINLEPRGAAIILELQAA
jgi:signal transduction histidine kinase